ncbi:hypothetical protein [Streptomyces daghestanicus]|uniref:hypothetical protein n=1 Tax=Streptomyces daghestanicus TaxID=66885 RepID=UPI001CFAD0A9|nr:hypothetical protein [Streptomyces daghestanicus]
MIARNRLHARRPGRSRLQEDHLHGAAEPGDGLDRPLAAARLPDHRQVVLGVQGDPQSLEEQGMVVDDEHTHGHGLSSGPFAPCRQ